MGNEDIGHFYYACGDWGNAHKAYLRMREHCTSTKHLADMTLRLVFVSIAQKSWMTVQSNLAKVDAAQLKGEEKTKLDPLLSALTGLAHMCLGHFREAASSFVNTSSAFLTAEPAAGIKWQREVLTGNDVAVYGGLCALASMDRTELQNQVLANNDFRNFLELFLSFSWTVLYHRSENFLDASHCCLAPLKETGKTILPFLRELRLICRFPGQKQ